MILKKLQQKVGEIYLGGGGISTDDLFILENLKINFQMDVGEFEVLLYNICQKNPSKITYLI